MDPAAALRSNPNPAPQCCCLSPRTIRITLIACAFIALLISVFTFAKVGALSQIGNTGGGVLIGVSALLVFCAYLARRSTPRRIPIPTYDELVAENPQLASLVAYKPEERGINLSVRYAFGERGLLQMVVREDSYLDEQGLREVMNMLRELYAETCERPNFDYIVEMRFHKGDREVTFNNQKKLAQLHTLDELIATKAGLAEILGNEKVNVSVAYEFITSSREGGDVERRDYAGMNVADFRIMYDGIRELYTKYHGQAGFQFSVALILCKDGGQPYRISYGNRRT